MFQKPSALDNLENKEEQHKAAVKALNEASTPSEQAKWRKFERKQYYQRLEAQVEYEKENSNR